jgi:hypothetical protein
MSKACIRTRAMWSDSGVRLCLSSLRLLFSLLEGMPYGSSLCKAVSILALSQWMREAKRSGRNRDRFKCNYTATHNKAVYAQNGLSLQEILMEQKIRVVRAGCVASTSHCRNAS